MISLNDFLSCIQQNVARITHYENAGDGSGNGGCDCIGLIIGALRLAGFRWPGTHGSNWAARNAVDGLSYINNASECFLGEIVFKAKEPGESGYELPPAYSNSQDRRDYYHVGVVTSVKPLRITHCTGVDGGIKTDSTLGKWRWGGRLKYVNYEEGGNDMVEPIYQAIVHAEGNKYPVRMRAEASKESAIVAKIEQGETVDVLGIVGGDEGEWGFILWHGMNGYMQKKFLIPANSGPSENDNDMPLTVNRTDWETVKTALETALNIINKYQ